jgi:hypothetical protein
MPTMYEIIGKQQVEIDTLKAEKAQLMAFLRQLKAGEVSLDDMHFGTAGKQPEPSLNGAVADGD